MVCPRKLNDAWISLPWRQLRGKSVKLRHGPAAVSEEFVLLCHWIRSGKAKTNEDAQVRRPAFTCEIASEENTGREVNDRGVFCVIFFVYGE